MPKRRVELGRPDPPGKRGRPRKVLDLPSWAVGLTKKEFAYVEQYLIDGNSVQAYTRVYRPKLAPIKSSHDKYGSMAAGAAAMKRRKQVAAAIGKAFFTLGITPAFVIDNYAKILNADVAECYEDDGKTVKSVHDIPDDVRFAISEVTPGEFGTKIGLESKKAANDAIAKALGMFKDRVELSGPDGGPIEVDPVEALLAKSKEMKKKMSEGSEGGGAVPV